MTDHYFRTRIVGALHCESDLHIGDGQALALEERGNTIAPDKKNFYQSICVGANGPYIPASTLRGFLRDVACSTLTEQVDRFFGYADKNEQSSGGCLRFYDATLSSSPEFSIAGANWMQNPVLWCDERKSSIRFGVALDPITQTAANKQLYCYEYIPRGSKFELEIETDRLCSQELAQILTLLEHWDGSNASAIGKGISNGQGRLRWQQDRIEILTEAQLLTWIKDSSDKTLGDYFKPLPKTPEISSTNPSTSYSMHVEIKPDAPFLIHDPAYKPNNKDKDSEETVTPDHLFSRTPDGRALIPAASLRGLIRARARRIITTIAHSSGATLQHAAQCANALVQTLFGSTDQRSQLRFSDCVAEHLTAPHEQMFNAVDRFTGGVAHQRLYQAQAADCTTLSGNLSLDSRCRFLSSWCKGLLLLIVRDTLEGELTLGWGKAKGYGAFHVNITLSDGVNITSWQALLDYLDQQQLMNDAEQWIDDLHGHIESFIHDCKRPQESAHG